MQVKELTGHDLIWNWARWCWAGETPGNMERYVPWEDEHRTPINQEHALAVERLHKSLRQHERMVIIAEYPRKNAWFGHVSSDERRAWVRRWVQHVTGAVLRDDDYKLIIARFQERVEKEVLG